MKTHVLITKRDFKVDEVNRVVICTIHFGLQFHKLSNDLYMTLRSALGYQENFKVKAIAKCNIKDLFDETRGKHIAETRAKAKMYKLASELYNEAATELKEFCNNCLDLAESCAYVQQAEENHIKELTQ